MKLQNYAPIPLPVVARSLSRATIAALVVAVALVAPPAHAQPRAIERLRLALDQTDQKIEQARNAAAASPDRRADAEVLTAESVQSRARAALNAGRPRIALDLTFEARTHADHVIGMFKGLPDPDRVNAEVERTGEILDRTRQRVQACDRPRAQNLMSLAGVMQERAQAALAENRYLAASELTMGARNHAFRAMRICGLQDDLPASAELALRRTDDLLAQARDSMGGSGSKPAGAALSEGSELQSRAQTEFRARRFEPSLKLTQAARAMAHRALRLSRAR